MAGDSNRIAHKYAIEIIAYAQNAEDVGDIEELVKRILRLDLDHVVVNKARLVKTAVAAKVMNMQSMNQAVKNVQHHYDIGNDLYRAMLGKTMTYSCGYWRDAKTLDAAQTNKLDLICRKLELEPGMRVLDVGCGWGSFVHYAAEHYGVSCVGNTLSSEQAAYARKLVSGQPVKIIVQDYRELKQKPFDRIVSIGMFEHVGPRNYATFMKTCERLLKPDGIMLLHTIGENKPHQVNDPWIERYIFPGGFLPAISDISKAITDLFIMEDWHNFGPDYGKTLRAWQRNFDKGYKTLDHRHYDQRFYRMWKFYLSITAAAFAVRNIQLWQVVLTKRVAEMEYKSIR